MNSGGEATANAGANATAMTGLLKGQSNRRTGHIYLPENGEEYWDPGKGEKRWRCLRCPTHRRNDASFSLKSTRNVLDHLEKIHYINRKTGDLIPAEQRTKNRPAGQPMLQFKSQTRTYDVKFHHRVYKAKLLDWIIHDNASFRVVGSKRFVSLLQYLLLTKPSLEEFLRSHPRDHTTIQRWVMKMFQQNKTQIQNEIEQSLSSVHISFDLWTSPNRHALLGVAGYWITKEGQRKGVLLGLRQLLGPHSGSNQAAIVWDVLKAYNIPKRLGYVTLDNASNNDTALLEIEERMDDLEFKFDKVKRRIRCFGHVINLSVQSFLWGLDANAFARLHDEDNNDINLAEEIESMKEWRKRGPLGKLHNIITHVNRSPQRIQAFEATVKEVQPLLPIRRLVVGCPTRWSSDYDSLELALSYQLSIDKYVDSEITMHRRARDHAPQRRTGRRRGNGTATTTSTPSTNTDFLGEDELTPNDWIILRAVHGILRPMRNFTKRIQGKTNTALVSEILPAMDMMLQRYEKVLLSHYKLIRISKLIYF